MCLLHQNRVIVVEDFKNVFLNKIEKKCTPQTFETWFKPLRVISSTSESVVFAVPKKFFSDWIIENYKDLIEEVVFDITKATPKIEFEVREDLYDKEKQHIELSSARDSLSSVQEKINSLPENINPEYSFSNFVIGSSNQFAHAACNAVANNPGLTYNPLFIYGGTGLGKTHLLHAIVNLSAHKIKNSKIFYISSEKFTNELINSIRYDKMFSFRNKYRNIDMLLIDDIQFIAGKERTQEEFFHTFNTLFELKKQIVLTSDKPPREINDLEERLRSRFEWGLIADIQPPETETKVAILKKKALSQKVMIPNDVAFLLANSVKSNIRELEGLLTRLIAYSSLWRCDITADFTKEVLRDIVKIEEKEPTPEDIKKTVSSYFKIKVSDLKSKKKSKSIVLPRQISMYILRKKTKLSFPEIGEYFGGRDHATVIYSINKIETAMKEDKKIKDIVETLSKKV